MITREAFLVEYRKRLIAGFQGWTSVPGKLERFMDAVRETLEGPRSPWSFDGPVTVDTWRALGLPGRPSLKALRALPAEKAP